MTDITKVWVVFYLLKPEFHGMDLTQNKDCNIDSIWTVEQDAHNRFNFLKEKPYISFISIACKALNYVRSDTVS